MARLGCVMIFLWLMPIPPRGGCGLLMGQMRCIGMLLPRLSLGSIRSDALASAVFFAGIRDALSRFTRRPCAGRHLLFFAAAKKSRQKKAAHTASANSCLRAPKGSYNSHGNALFNARCQRFESAPHPLHAPVQQPASANGMCRPGGKLCVGVRTINASLRTR